MAPIQTARNAVLQRRKSIQKTFHKHGIHISGWFQLLVWTVAIAMLLGLTVNDFLPLLSDYRNDSTNVAIKTRLVINEPFTPPPLIVMFPHFKMINSDANAMIRIAKYLYMGNETGCIECRKLADVSWDVWRDMNFSSFSDYFNLQSSITVAIISKLLYSMKNGADIFDDEYSDWNSPVIDAGLMFLIWQTSIDRSFGSVLDPRNDLSTLDLQEYSLNKTWNGTHLLDLLYTKVMKALCKDIQMKVEISWNETEYTCIQLMTQDSLPVLIDDSGLWLPIPTNANKEYDLTFSLWNKSQGNTTNMWIPQEDKGPLQMSQQWQMWFYTDAASQYSSDLDSVPYWFSTFDAEMIGSTWPFTTFTYGMIMRAIEQREYIKAHCYNETSPNVCLTKCSKLWIIQNCACIPFTFRKGLNLTGLSLPYCTSNHYNTCDPMANKDVQQKECVKNCADPCEYNSYTLRVVRDNEDNPDQIGFKIVTKPLIGPFVEFAWTTKDTPQTFASQVGGIFGLYLGLSGLSIFICIITCVDFVKRLYGRKRYNEIRENARAISLWQMVLMRKITREERSSHDNQLTDFGKTNGQRSDHEKCFCKSISEKFEMHETRLKELEAHMYKKYNSHSSGKLK